MWLLPLSIYQQNLAGSTKKQSSVKCILHARMCRSSCFLLMLRVLYPCQCGESFPWLWSLGTWILKWLGIAKAYCVPWWKCSLIWNQNLYTGKVQACRGREHEFFKWVTRSVVSRATPTADLCFLGILFNGCPAPCKSHCFRAYAVSSMMVPHPQGIFKLMPQLCLQKTIPLPCQLGSFW